MSIRIQLKSNLPAFEALMKRRKELLPVIVASTVEDGTALALRTSRALLQQMVYDKPIPPGKNGVAAWRRTGRLLRGERMVFRGSGVKLVGIVDNDTPYAVIRHESRQRPAKWRKAAAREVRPVVKRIFEERLGKV